MKTKHLEFGTHELFFVVICANHTQESYDSNFYVDKCNGMEVFNSFQDFFIRSWVTWPKKGENNNSKDISNSQVVVFRWTQDMASEQRDTQCQPQEETNDQSELTHTCE